MKDSVDDLLAKIERFMARHGIPAGRFGTESCGNKHIVRRLRNGFGCNMRTGDRIIAYMEAYAGNVRRPKRPRPKSSHRAAA